MPAAALGAVLVGAAFSLFNVRALREFYQIDRRELALSLLATIGVVTVGTTKAIFVAVILALLRFVSLISRPRVEVLGSVAGMTGLHSIDRHENAATIPGLLLVRFNGPIVFFNASFFKSSILQAVEAAGPGLKWLVIDMIPVTIVDMTGLHAARDLIGSSSRARCCLQRRRASDGVAAVVRNPGPQRSCIALFQVWRPPSKHTNRRASQNRKAGPRLTSN